MAKREPRVIRPRWVVEPFDWSLSGPARGIRNDLQEILLFPIVRSFSRMEIIGAENLNDEDGPCVIVANHTSHFDCPLILACLPHHIRHKTIVAAAADYFFKVQAVGAMASLALGAIPFHRHEGSRESLEKLKEGIRRGWSVLIFPEGSRSQSGRLGHFKQGAAYLCVDTRCRAVPIYIEGAYDILPKGASFPRPGRVKATIGRPIGPTPSDDYESFTERLHEAVTALGVKDEQP
ncbi:MAG TPA: lysophospholipid acyltransferase family protein [Actinomycetota bacterium]|nr:lysophospholipid acyltransferase family protein [Actinomycetota bacterium]